MIGYIFALRASSLSTEMRIYLPMHVESSFFMLIAVLSFMSQNQRCLQGYETITAQVPPR